MTRFRGGLVFKARRLVYHSTLGWRVIQKKKNERSGGTDAGGEGVTAAARGRPGSPGCHEESEARMVKVNLLTPPAGLSERLYPWPDAPIPLLLTDAGGGGGVTAADALRSRERPSSPLGPPGTQFISQKVFIQSLCKSQFPYKFVNLLFILVIIKDELTDLCGN